MQTDSRLPQVSAPVRARRFRTKLTDINAFLAQKRVAFVGVSRNDQDYSRMVMRDFESRGYEVVPVNPGATEIGGRPCYARVQEIIPPVTAALLFTPPGITDAVVGECVAAGVQHIWIRRVSVQNAWSVALCREQGIGVVTGECPLMFLPQTAGVHRFHGMLKKITWTYPR